MGANAKSGVGMGGGAQGNLKGLLAMGGSAVAPAPKAFAGIGGFGGGLNNNGVNRNGGGGGFGGFGGVNSNGFCGGGGSGKGGQGKKGAAAGGKKGQAGAQPAGVGGAAGGPGGAGQAGAGAGADADAARPERVDAAYVQRRRQTARQHAEEVCARPLALTPNPQAADRRQQLEQSVLKFRNTGSGQYEAVPLEDLRVYLTGNKELVVRVNNFFVQSNHKHDGYECVVPRGERDAGLPPVNINKIKHGANFATHAIDQLQDDSAALRNVIPMGKLATHPDVKANYKGDAKDNTTEPPKARTHHNALTQALTRGFAFTAAELQEQDLMRLQGGQDTTGHGSSSSSAAAGAFAGGYGAAFNPGVGPLPNSGKSSPFDGMDHDGLAASGYDDDGDDMNNINNLKLNLSKDPMHISPYDDSVDRSEEVKKIQVFDVQPAHFGAIVEKLVRDEVRFVDFHDPQLWGQDSDFEVTVCGRSVTDYNDEVRQSAEVALRNRLPAPNDEPIIMPDGLKKYFETTFWKAGDNLKLRSYQIQTVLAGLKRLDAGVPGHASYATEVTRYVQLRSDPRHVYEIRMRIPSNKRCLLLADDAGMGKTVSMIALIGAIEFTLGPGYLPAVPRHLAFRRLIPLNATLVLVYRRLGSHWPDQFERFVQPGWRDDGAILNLAKVKTSRGNWRDATVKEWREKSIEDWVRAKVIFVKYEQLTSKLYQSADEENTRNRMMDKKADVQGSKKKNGKGADDGYFPTLSEFYFKTIVFDELQELAEDAAKMTTTERKKFNTQVKHLTDIQAHQKVGNFSLRQLMLILIIQ